jgi:hypothetical protein
LDDVGVRHDGSIAEVEHVVQRAGDAVCRASADTLAAEEDVLDEAGDRGLIGDGGVDCVLLRPGGDDQEGLTWTVAAASLSVECSRVEAGQSGCCCGGADADAGSVDSVGGSGGAVDGVVDVIVPAVGVVIGDDDGGARPER